MPFSRIGLALLLMVPAAAWGDLHTYVDAMGFGYPVLPGEPPAEESCWDNGTSYAACSTTWGAAHADASYTLLSLEAAWFGGGAVSGAIGAGFSDTLTVGAPGPGVLELIWYMDFAAFPPAAVAQINGAAPAACPAGSPPWMMFCTPVPFTPGVPVSISASLEGDLNLDLSRYRDPSSFLALEDLLITDAAGAAIRASIQSGSGADYPIDPRSTVPEPSTYLLLGGAAAVYGLRRYWPSFFTSLISNSLGQNLPVTNRRSCSAS